MQSCTEVINSSLFMVQQSMVLIDLNRSDQYMRHLSFSPLTYNGEVTKLT